jgi:hypothetical protein
MPITNPSLYSCLPKTAYLADYFGKNVPNGRDNGQLAFLQWLLSSENLSGVRKLSDDIIGVPGKKRGVRMQFDTPMCLQVCTTEWNCLDPKEPISPAIQFAEFEILSEYHVCDATGKPAALTFDESEWAQYCELNDMEFLQSQFSRFDMKMFQALDKEMVQLLRTLIPAAHEYTFPFLRENSTTGFKTLSDEWLLWVSQVLVDQGYDLMDVVIFGGKFIQTLKHKYKISTASTEGFNLGATAGDMPNMYYDKNFDAVFGANAFVVIPKNSLQLVTFNKYVGNKSFTGETAINGTKTMPLGNGASVTFDYQWRRDIECPKYSYFPSLYAELVKAIPGSCTDPTADGLLVFKDCGNNANPVC